MERSKTLESKIHHLWETSAFNFFLNISYYFIKALFSIIKFHPTSFKKLYGQPRHKFQAGNWERKDVTKSLMADRSLEIFLKRNDRLFF